MSVTACLSLIRSHANVLVFACVRNPPAPPAETRCVAGIHVRPGHQALPKETKAGRHNSRTRQRAQTDSHYPAALGLSVCRTWCRDGLTAVVRAYPRRSSHQVVVRARKMTPLVTQAAPISKGRTRPRHAKHQWTEDMPGGIWRRANNQRTCEA